MEVTKEVLKKESWKFYFVLIMWPLYLFSLPFVASKLGILTLFYVLFPGLYLFTWAAYLMHESWHKYVSNLPMNLFYKLFSWMLITDPQVYGLLHGIHHSKVNTYEDLEFYPIGRVNNIHLRRIYNILEIVFGIAFLSVVASISLPKNANHKNKFSRKGQIQSIIIWILFFTVIGGLSNLVFDVTIAQIVVSYALAMWFYSFAIHQSQLIEHGILIVHGDYSVRNIQTRNLSKDGIMEKIFLFFFHNDANEHVLHHTKPNVYNRPFPKQYKMPENAVYISLKEYLSILIRMIKGEEDIKELQDINNKPIA